MKTKYRWKSKKETYWKLTICLAAVMLLGLGIFYFHYIKNPPRVPEPCITLYLSQEKKTVTLPLEEYLIGTVAAEMPASFELEALKAQAVCARTYALRKLLEDKPYPCGADLSDDITSCQAYISAQEYARRNPAHKDLYKKVQQAVKATRGMILIYKGQPIDALYHSTCGGRTETADIPYLQSVRCEFCQPSHYYKTVQAFAWKDLNSSGIGRGAVTVIEKTPSGRIRKLQIGRQAFSGETFRSQLELPSTWWQFRVNDEQLIIYSQGYGHGLGLCQWGAQGMAQKGNNYREILGHYYTNISWCQLPY